MRAVIKRTPPPSATENDDLSACLFAGRRTRNARFCRAAVLQALARLGSIADLCVAGDGHLLGNWLSAAWPA